MAKTTEEIAQMIGETSFRKRLLGGVDEQDVWDTIERMHEQYRELVQEEKIRCAALLEEREEFVRKQNGRILSLRRRLAEYGIGGDDGETR